MAWGLRFSNDLSCSSIRARNGSPGFLALHHEAKAGEGGGRFLFGIVDALHAVEHHFAQHVAQVAAGQRGVADEGHSLGREELSAEGEQVIPHRLRYPGVDAVRDDVVELPELSACFEQIALKEADICQAKRSNALLPALHRQTGQVKADEFAFWDGISHGDEVRAFIARDFEHPASLDRSGERPCRIAMAARWSGWVSGYEKPG